MKSTSSSSLAGVGRGGGDAVYITIAWIFVGFIIGVITVRSYGCEGRGTSLLLESSQTHQYVSAFNDHDTSRIKSLLYPNVILEENGAVKAHDVDGFIRVLTALFAEHPNVHLDIASLLVEGVQHQSVIEFRITGLKNPKENVVGTDIFQWSAAGGLTRLSAFFATVSN
eukprot:PhM_4_TR7245/c0_g1_i1/m.42837